MRETRGEGGERKRGQRQRKRQRRRSFISRAAFVYVFDFVFVFLANANCFCEEWRCSLAAWSKAARRCPAVPSPQRSSKDNIHGRRGVCVGGGRGTHTHARTHSHTHARTHSLLTSMAANPRRAVAPAVGSPFTRHQGCSTAGNRVIMPVSSTHFARLQHHPLFLTATCFSTHTRTRTHTHTVLG